MSGSLIICGFISTLWNFATTLTVQSRQFLFTFDIMMKIEILIKPVQMLPKLLCYQSYAFCSLFTSYIAQYKLLKMLILHLTLSSLMKHCFPNFLIQSGVQFLQFITAKIEQIKLWTMMISFVSKVTLQNYWCYVLVVLRDPNIIIKLFPGWIVSLNM